MTKITAALNALALSYAIEPIRPALNALFELDAALGQVLRTTHEPMVGQMRLAWWRDALERLDVTPPPGEPVLRQLADFVLPAGVTGADLSKMVDGWEPLLGELDDEAIEQHATLRGSLLFELTGSMLDVEPGDPVTFAGRGWALADLATNLSDGEVAARARERARQPLAAANSARWSRAGRPLGALALVAARNGSETAEIVTVFRLAWHRLTGR